MKTTRATRRLVQAVLALVTASAAIAAQSPAPLTFEVASVKLDPKQGRGGPVPMAEFGPPRVLPGGRFESRGQTLRNLIAYAWDINTLYRRIEGPQEFLETELVISARAASPALTTAEARAMVGALLEERFRLRWRWEPREVDGYALMPAREDGPRPVPTTRASESRVPTTSSRHRAAGS